MLGECQCSSLICKNTQYTAAENQQNFESQQKTKIEEVFRANLKASGFKEVQIRTNTKEKSYDNDTKETSQTKFVGEPGSDKSIDTTRSETKTYIIALRMYPIHLFIAFLVVPL